MRCNPKFFEIGNAGEAFEIQEFDGRKVELFYMNDFDSVFDQSLVQGRFAMWTSVDGFNYRLYIEHGFHDEVKQLYTQNVNKIWLDYWDEIDKFTKKINFKILLPICIGLIVLLMVLTMIIKDSKVATILQIALAAAFIVGMFMTSGFQKRKAQQFHLNAMEEIKKEVGQNNFDRMIDIQNTYINNYLEERAKAEEAAYRAEHPEDFEDEVTEPTEALDQTLVESTVVEETNNETKVEELEIVEEVKEEKELD